MTISAKQVAILILTGLLTKIFFQTQVFTFLHLCGLLNLDVSSLNSLCLHKHPFHLSPFLSFSLQHGDPLVPTGDVDVCIPSFYFYFFLEVLLLLPNVGIW